MVPAKCCGRRAVCFPSSTASLRMQGIKGHLVVAWRAPNGQTIVAVVLGSADHPSRYNYMRAILAALPHDFPELAEPAASSGAASQDGGVRRCL